PESIAGGGVRRLGIAHPQCQSGGVAMLWLRPRAHAAPAPSGSVRGGGGRALPPGSVAWKHRKASGELFDVITDMGNLPHEPVPSHLMLVRDVSGEQAAQSALDEAEARFEDLIESGLAMVWMHDPEGRLLWVNAAMADALGHERENMTGRPLSDFVADEAHEHWDDYLDRTRSLK